MLKLPTAYYRCSISRYGIADGIADFYAPNKINNPEHLNLSVTTLYVSWKCIASLFFYCFAFKSRPTCLELGAFRSVLIFPKAHLQLYYSVPRSFIDLLQASSLWVFMLSRQLRSNRWRPTSRSIYRLLKAASVRSGEGRYVMNFFDVAL